MDLPHSGLTSYKEERKVIGQTQSRDATAPLVSVVIPAYARPRLLRECLHSIRQQSLDAFECIVVDDASPLGDEIREIVEELRDARFQLIRRDSNGGPAAGRNTGILAARAEYFVSVDEDDLLAPNALEVLHKEIVEGNADAVCPQARIFGGKDGVRKAQAPTLEKILGGMILLPNGWIMKKRLWEEIGGYDEAPALRGRDDWEIWIRALARGAVVRVLPDTHYFYRLPADPEGRDGTLEHRARLGEVGFMRYVLRKHRLLYNRYPAIRKRLLQRSVRLERERWLQEGFRSEVFVKAFWWVVYSNGWRERARSLKTLAVLVMSRLNGEGATAGAHIRV